MPAKSTAQHREMLFRQWLKKRGAGLEAQNARAVMYLKASRKLGEILKTDPNIQPGNPLCMVASCNHNG
jgi:predicted phage-related endonuclease